MAVWKKGYTELEAVNPYDLNVALSLVTIEEHRMGTGMKGALAFAKLRHAEW